MFQIDRWKPESDDRSLCVSSVFTVMCTTRIDRAGDADIDGTTIEDFTEEIDDAGFIRQCNSSHMLMRMFCLCLALMNLLLRVALLLPVW